MCKAADLQDSEKDIFCPYNVSKNRYALVVIVNKRAGLDKRTLARSLLLSPLCLVLIWANWVVNLVCSEQTPISERETEIERVQRLGDGF